MDTSTENQNMRRSEELTNLYVSPAQLEGDWVYLLCQIFQKSHQQDQDEFTGIIYFIVHFPVLSCILRGLLWVIRHFQGR